MSPNYWFFSLGNYYISKSAFVDFVPLSNSNGHIFERFKFYFIDFSEFLSFVFITENIISIVNHRIDFLSIEFNEETG